MFDDVEEVQRWCVLILRLEVMKGYERGVA
jgi:hypothetical protein